MTLERHTLILILPVTLLGVLVILLFIPDWNSALFLKLNAWGQGLSARFWSSVTMLGDAGVMLGLMALLFWRNPRALRAMLLLAIMATLVTQGLKETFDYDRPAAVLSTSDFQVIGEALKHHSFPSGHTLTAFAGLALTMLVFKLQHYWWGFFLAALFIGLSRVMVGVHWPQDVAFGGLLGWVLAFIAYYLVYTFGGNRYRVWLLGLLGLIAVSVVAQAVDYPLAWGVWLVAAISAVMGFVFAVNQARQDIDYSLIKDYLCLGLRYLQLVWYGLLAGVRR